MGKNMLNITRSKPKYDDEVKIESIHFEDKSSKPIKMVRLVLILLLVIVLIGSLAVFSVGVLTHEVEYGSKQISDLIGVAMYQVDSIMMIGVGMAAFLITILGLIAILKNQRCLLGLHLVILAFLSIMLFVGGVLGYIFIAELEDTVERNFENSIKKYYGVNLNVGKNRDITSAWDNVQSTFGCCGAYGNINSTTSWAIYKKHSFWYLDGIANGSMVPASCCGEGDLFKCMGRANATASPDAPPYVGPPSPNVGSVGYSLYTEGCYDKLHSYLVQNGILIGTVAIVVAVFMFIQMSLSIFLHRKMKYMH
ncbi:tetraspanin-15-like [Mizuhopecten yessoensis]|uniref:Tetraspanin n=1 Tax=Mizuhopecten yessoensis TaxID=6573 RepID=A0A210QLQ4_MIZYE|nr:tetraspanin-15-like [Mizuhopecten yessoensis]XP_021355093.1 tetraspanin-15-like [Mizuhopecten yessoensis]XP_021355095.1 tetraspanin-15-like [Mizuhopecten yessoensis]XP_021355096.1 tetraspanin-15-like [Mizuhopecten yessoensis]XP_021355097.1 tetraspanin-15-like [Mizuhopecten yessoensis]OWF49670.1 Tetraspanin-11 [Mizuhopecten yessoensis]